MLSVHQGDDNDDDDLLLDQRDYKAKTLTIQFAFFY